VHAALAGEPVVRLPSLQARAARHLGVSTPRISKPLGKPGQQINLGNNVSQLWPSRLRASRRPVRPTKEVDRVSEQISGVWTAQLRRPFRLELPFPGEEFALLLVVAAPDVTAAERESLSRAFVAQGCRYAVCTGVGASGWDEAIDYAAVQAELERQRPSERRFMLAWHDDEPLQEVTRFFLHQTALAGFAPSRRIALVLGGPAEELQELRGVLKGVGGGPTRG
jgi:hypothetical protein